MRSWIRRSGLALACCIGGSLPVGGLAGCEASVSHRRPAYAQSDFFVYDAPPRPRRDVMFGPAPGPDFFWVNGHWYRDRGRWAWMNGYWERRPFSRASWRPGRWDRRGRGWVWVGGQWR